MAGGTSQTRGNSSDSELNLSEPFPPCQTLSAPWEKKPKTSQKISGKVSGDSDSLSLASDSDYDTDSDLARVLGQNLNPNLRVAKIQLEVRIRMASGLKTN